MSVPMPARWLAVLALASSASAAYTIRPPDAKQRLKKAAEPPTTRGKEVKEWHTVNAIFLPGVFSDALDDEQLMLELRAIDERAATRALAARQLREQQQQRKPELPELSRRFALMQVATEPLDALHLGELTIDWIESAAERCAADYLSLIGSLLEAREYVEELQTERGLLTATVGKFGPYSLMRRMDDALGPAPSTAPESFASSTLARAHRPTIWKAFSGAVSRALQQQAFRSDGGQRTGSWRARPEWRVLVKLGEIGQPANKKRTRGPKQNRRQERVLRSLQYKADGGTGGRPEVRLPPTRKQRTMAALARSIAAAKEKEEREREEEKRKDETLQKKLQALRDRKFPEPRAAGVEANK